MKKTPVKKIKVEVLERFKDKHTGKGYKVGDKLTITEERLKEIQSTNANLVKVVVEATDKAAEKPAKKNAE